MKTFILFACQKKRKGAAQAQRPATYPTAPLYLFLSNISIKFVSSCLRTLSHVVVRPQTLLATQIQRCKTNGAIRAPNSSA